MSRVRITIEADVPEGPETYPGDLIAAMPSTWVLYSVAVAAAPPSTDWPIDRSLYDLPPS